MPQFQIVNESTEDTLALTESLPEAVRMAKDIARQGLAGDPVSILESGGKAIQQFILMPNGRVEELAIGSRSKP